MDILVALPWSFEKNLQHFRLVAQHLSLHRTTTSISRLSMLYSFKARQRKSPSSLLPPEAWELNSYNMLAWLNNCTIAAAETVREPDWRASRLQLLEWFNLISVKNFTVSQLLYEPYQSYKTAKISSTKTHTLDCYNGHQLILQT